MLINPYKTKVWKRNVWKLDKTIRNNGNKTENLIDYSCHKNYFKLIVIDLSRQTNMAIVPEINSTGKLGKDIKAKLFFIAEQKYKAILNFSSDSF